MEDAAQAPQSAPEGRAKALLRATSPTPSEMGWAAPTPADMPPTAVDKARAFLAAVAPADGPELSGVREAISGAPRLGPDSKVRSARR
eukprot:9117458-Alexandrium_andersonii.AAC.1